MMSDLIERLRSCSEDFRVEYREAEGCSIYAEAADEIERLQAEMDTDHVQHMLNIKRKDAEIKRLQKAYRPADMIEYQELVEENERLRAALEWIANKTGYWLHMKEIAKDALRRTV